MLAKRYIELLVTQCALQDPSEIPGALEYAKSHYPSLLHEIPYLFKGARADEKLCSVFEPPPSAPVWALGEEERNELLLREVDANLNPNPNPN